MLEAALARPCNGSLQAARRPNAADQTQHAASLSELKIRRDEEQCDEARRRFVTRLCELEPAVAAARELALRFIRVMRDRDGAGLEEWLAQASRCPIIEMRRFAAGLQADLYAVRAAVALPWSSGQVEGQINRLKYLKRQMYGRAGLELLAIRVVGRA